MIYDFDLTGFPDSNSKRVERFTDYEKTPGVWACWGQNSDNEWVCLNVGSGKTIGKEMRVDLKYSNGKFKHKNSMFRNYNNKEVFEIKRPKNEPITTREHVWFDIGKNYNNLVFVIVLLSADEGEEKSLEAERLEVESKYAHDHEAMYWNPSPRQK